MESTSTLPPIRRVDAFALRVGDDPNVVASADGGDPAPTFDNAPWPRIQRKSSWGPAVPTTNPADHRRKGMADRFGL